jgi:predicted DNA-binding protein
MLKDVQMTFRIEPELRAKFTEAALSTNRPAAQVLREFMRSFVEDAGQRPVTISPAERRRRQEAVDFARASVGLEGFVISAEREEASRRFIAGEIDMEGYFRAVRPQEVITTMRSAATKSSEVSEEDNESLNSHVR